MRKHVPLGSPNAGRATDRAAEPSGTVKAEACRLCGPRASITFLIERWEAVARERLIQPAILVDSGVRLMGGLYTCENHSVKERVSDLLWMTDGPKAVELVRVRGGHLW